MKRLFAGVALGLCAACFAANTIADEKGHFREVKGTLVKIDGNFYVIKDKSGREHRYVFDNSTKKEGDVKEGAEVEIYVDKDHVAKIVVE